MCEYSCVCCLTCNRPRTGVEQKLPQCATQTENPREAFGTCQEGASSRKIQKSRQTPPRQTPPQRAIIDFTSHSTQELPFNAGAERDCAPRPSLSPRRLNHWNGIPKTTNSQSADSITEPITNIRDTQSTQNDPPWSCVLCTYQHVTSEALFLMCKICSSPRPQT